MASRQVLLVGVLAALAIPGAALARAGAAPSFATKAAEGGMAEVQLGKLASDHASNMDVRDFAQRMVTDHSKADDELMRIARDKGWTLPQHPGSSQRAEANRLSKESGTAFDRSYMREMTSDHDKDVAMFRSYAKSGKDPDLRAWAQKTLPTIEEHQRLAHSTSDKLGSSAPR